jgi:hypothetical protein
MQAGVEWLLQGSLVGCLLSNLDSDETLSFTSTRPPALISCCFVVQEDGCFYPSRRRLEIRAKSSSIFQRPFAACGSSAALKQHQPPR